MACCKSCASGGPCASQALDGTKFHQGGVTQLQYVGDADGLGDSSWVMSALQYGLLAMGVACLLGINRNTARLIGIAGVGYGLMKKGAG